MPEIPNPNPQLMVIGDSLPQGCRSLSVTREMCAQSWPARYAALNGIEFVTPNFPRPVLLNLETLIRRLSIIENVRDRQTMNEYLDELCRDYNAWIVNADSVGPETFDNLAVSGTLFSDITDRTAKTCQDDIDDFVSKFGATMTSRTQFLRLFKHREDLRKLHLAINARFVLNPTNNPDFANFSSLDWVKARKPATLIVHAGHNHGLYGIGNDADGSDTLINPAEGEHFFEQWDTLTDQLAKLPPEITRIYIGLLPKVGSVSNLAPQTAERVDGYAPMYEPVFSTSGKLMPGPRLKEIDAAIAAMNKRMQDIMAAKEAAAGTAGRTVFIDLFSIFEKYDFKNTLDPMTQIVGATKLPLDNLYLESHLTRLGLSRELQVGGLQTIDGMHLSGVGYALLASEVVASEGKQFDRTPMLQQAFAQDRLLNSPPHALGTLLSALGIIRDTNRVQSELVSHVKQQLSEGLALDGETSIFDILSFLKHLGR